MPATAASRPPLPSTCAATEYPAGRVKVLSLS
jgi:hypothetical protein